MHIRIAAPLAWMTLAGVVGAAHAESLNEGHTSAVRASANIDSQRLDYIAKVGRVAIRDVETGEPHGWMGYTAYQVARAEDRRPVMFVWNGGPGANSTLLHFKAAGPKRVDGAALVDNEDSWLSVTDLVFVDPIGTGFSRPTKEEYATEFYGTVGDVASVTEFVRAWLLQNGAEDRAVYLAGESWGAGRAAKVAASLQSKGRPVEGIILISGGWGFTQDYGSRIVQRALGVADMAVAAAYHGKADPALGRDPDRVRAKVASWVRDAYAPTLARADAASDAERDAITAQLSRFTGVPASVIDRKSLTITPRQFCTELLKKEGKEAYFLDLRLTAAPAEPGNARIVQYLRKDLGYATDLPYIGIEDWVTGYAPGGKFPEPVGHRWNYATAPITQAELEAAVNEAAARGDGPPTLGPPLPGTEDALARNPRMRVFVAAGAYDSYVPCAAGEDIARSLPSQLAGRIAFRCYPGGHAMYEDAAVRTSFARDVRAFVTKH
jgi:carboxypeptidase C (cathepsin A)